MLNRTLLLIALFITGIAHADSFDVQIGAFRSPDTSKIKLPANVGELRTTSGPNGLTRFLVGPYSNRADANRAQDTLRAAGFKGAFVRAAQQGRIRVSASTTSSSLKSGNASSSNSNEMSQEALQKLISLSEEERRGLVILDGKLHRKVGDEFVPVRD